MFATQFHTLICANKQSICCALRWRCSWICVADPMCCPRYLAISSIIVVARTLTHVHDYLWVFFFSCILVPVHDWWNTRNGRYMYILYIQNYDRFELHPIVRWQMIYDYAPHTRTNVRSAGRFVTGIKHNDGFVSSVLYSNWQTATHTINAPTFRSYTHTQ